jgi:hypothetical protein
LSQIGGNLRIFHPREEEDLRMNKQTLQLALLCLLAASTVTRAHAQSKIAVKVPFDFSISDKTFPAGEYSVSSSRDRDHLIVQDSAGKPVFIGIANPITGRRVGSTGMVVFHCYDARCFLSEFWTPFRENGSQLLPSRREAALAKRKKGTDFALLDPTKQH